MVEVTGVPLDMFAAQSPRPAGLESPVSELPPRGSMTSYSSAISQLEAKDKLITVGCGVNGKVVKGWMHYRRGKNVRLLDVCNVESSSDKCS